MIHGSQRAGCHCLLGLKIDPHGEDETMYSDGVAQASAWKLSTFNTYGAHWGGGWLASLEGRLCRWEVSGCSHLGGRSCSWQFLRQGQHPSAPDLGKVLPLPWVWGTGVLGVALLISTKQIHLGLHLLPTGGFYPGATKSSTRLSAIAVVSIVSCAQPQAW